MPQSPTSTTPYLNFPFAPGPIVIARLFAILALLIMPALLIGPGSGPAFAQNNVLKDLLNPNGAQITIDKGKIRVEPRPVLCPQPFVPKNGNCVCPAGTKRSGNRCLPLLRCPDSFVADSRGNCVCPQGRIVVNNRCVKLQLNCTPPFVKRNNKCVCPVGERRVGNRCEPLSVNIQCNSPFVPNANQTRCVCPADTRRVGNTCEAIVNRPQCVFPFVYSSRKDDCVCTRGYELNRRGTRCLRVESQPSLPRATVREIQRCLNKVGYEAGPADGAAGRKTRAAWNAFRTDNALQGRPQSLSDTVTQNRLFQACAKAANTPAPAPAPAPQPDPAPAPDTNDGDIAAITNFDPENGYPPAQCASAELLELMKPVLPEEQLPGLCGQACVPIPQGMTQEQIAATAESVNWCLNCTDLGPLGLLCEGKPQKEENAN